MTGLLALEDIAGTVDAKHPFRAACVDIGELAADGPPFSTAIGWHGSDIVIAEPDGVGFVLPD